MQVTMESCGGVVGDRGCGHWLVQVATVGSSSSCGDADGNYGGDRLLVGTNW